MKLAVKGGKKEKEKIKKLGIKETWAVIRSTNL